MKGKLIISLPLILFVFVIEAQQQHVKPMQHRNHDSNSVTLELMHRHAPRFNHNKHKTQHQRLKDLVHHDIIHHNIIRTRTRRLLEEEHPAAGSSIEMPLASGSDYGIGQYVTSFRVGTPSQKFNLIVDTGSELTWIRCQHPCSRGDRNCTIKGSVNQKRMFQAPLSSSFSPVPCSSDMCQVELLNLFSLKCPESNPTSHCAYDYRYKDGSSAIGVFANETVTASFTNGSETKLQNVLIGCTNSFDGPTFRNVDGVMGLANTKYSFAAYAAEKFDGKFSYCLVDHLRHFKATSYIKFGSPDQGRVNVTGNTRITNLDIDHIPMFYGVNVKGISVDDKMLDIPTKVWDVKQGGGTILDSGTSLTFLADPAYNVVMEAIEKSVSMYQRVKLDGVPMEYCFNSTGFNGTLVSKLMVHFDDGARFEPHWDSYVIAAADGIRCLGFLPARFPAISMIGNIMQQNYLWEFDLKAKKLTFGPSKCE